MAQQPIYVWYGIAGSVVTVELRPRGRETSRDLEIGRDLETSRDLERWSG
jgi:hypothetical protein